MIFLHCAPDARGDLGGEEEDMDFGVCACAPRRADIVRAIIISSEPGPKSPVITT